MLKRYMLCSHCDKVKVLWMMTEENPRKKTRTESGWCENCDKHAEIVKPLK